MSDKKGCTKPDCFPYCDCGSADDYVPATPSEDGGEVPEVVGYRSRSNGICDEDSYCLHDPEPLMTVAQCKRIVAAKDAEISRLRVDNEALAANLRGKHSTTGATYTHLIAERDELRAQLAAQQAAVPVAYLRESDLNRLKPGYVAGCAASLNKEPAAGYVPVYLSAPAAPQQGDDEPLHCDFCQCELTDPWHGSGFIDGQERRHIHACDACRDNLPGSVECENCRSGNGGYEAMYRHAYLEVRRLVNDLLAERNGVFPELVSHAFVTGESGNGQYRVVMKFDSLERMQAAHNYLARLNPSAQVATYTTQPGESLMGIALRQLKDESRWVEVRDLNASEHPDMGPHDYYPVGTVLKMPDRSAQGGE